MQSEIKKCAQQRECRGLNKLEKIVPDKEVCCEGADSVARQNKIIVQEMLQKRRRRYNGVYAGIFRM